MVAGPPYRPHRSRHNPAMIPIASTAFWGPMAYAIMGGLSVATVLTLIFLPALYRVKEQ
jgi:multidrug efflux pump subunit AcrB